MSRFTETEYTEDVRSASKHIHIHLVQNDSAIDAPGLMAESRFFSSMSSSSFLHPQQEHVTCSQ